MYAQEDPSLGKLGQFFRGKRHQDSLWSWVVCISAMICNALGLGFALSFGVLLPVLMDYFGETSEKLADKVATWVFNSSRLLSVYLVFPLFPRKHI